MEDKSQDKGQSSDSDSSSLKIAVENEESPRKKRRKVFNSSDLDKTIEETIEKCENITPEVAKKMLLKLIKNEHVLALSLLKAEEQEFKTSDSEDEDKKSEIEAPVTPKLTRLKAKQLNQTLPIPGSLKNTEPCEDVVALINDEMKSDDEDDEYQPFDSDDDTNNQTLSDIESQPSTPGSALFQSEQDIDSPVKDGDFKVPTSQLSAEEQENISRRTRSKLCLTTTPIETIESAFIPPDITTDMYDFYPDHEIDNDWMGFLSEFLMPLNNAEEDDEKSDPEYVAAESVPVDKEELRPVRVSKKELNQLISELLEDTSSLNFDSEPSTSHKRNDQMPLNKSRRSRTQSPKISSRLYTQQELNTPPIGQERVTAVTPEPLTPVKTRDKLPASLEDINDNFYDQHLLTPQRMGFSTPNVMQSPVIFSSPPSVCFPAEPLPVPAVNIPLLTSPAVSKMPQITGVYGSAVPSLQSPTAPQVLVVNAQNQLEVQSPMNLMSQVFCSNGVMQLPQFQSIIVQVPTIDLLQNRLNLSSIVAPTETKQLTSLEVKQELPSDTISVKKQTHHKKEKLSEFEHLETETPPVERNFENQLFGFTYEQRNVYEQQMRMHSQLLAQNFMQVFANPKWWEKAVEVKSNLKELQAAVDPKLSPSTSQHIEECLKLCNDWEKELDDNSERNKKYAEYTYQEHELDVNAFDDKLPFKSNFHPRFMEHMLSSKAILYPKLLPHIPFRAVTFKHIDVTNSELRLLAFGLDQIYREQYRKLNSLNPYRLREPKIGSLARDIIRQFKSFRNEKGVIKIIENYKNHKRMNPIKYFFTHKKAPPLTHEIEDVDLDFIVPPKNLRRGLLPKSWDAYMFSHERLQIHPYQLAVKGQTIVEDLTGSQSCEENVERSPQFSSSISPEAESKSTEISVDQYKLEIVYEDIPKINIRVVAKPPKESPEISVIALNGVQSPEILINLSNPTKGREKSTEEKQKNLISILKKVTDCLEKSPRQKKSVNFLLPSPPPPNRSSSRIIARTKATQDIANVFSVSQTFFIVIESFFTGILKNIRFRDDAHPLLIRSFHWTKTIDVYSQLVRISMKSQDESNMTSKKRHNDASASEVAPKPKKNVSSSEEYSKRLHRKLTENRNLIMQSECKNKCTVEKDCSYAYNYLERVKKTLSENGDDELYKDFMSMLTSFDPQQESVPELYHKIESLLMPNYSDLVDLFLTFLLPEHAAEIGKFFEHFCLSNMTNLLKKLNVYFKDQPSNMKKVYTVLNDLSNEEDLTMDRLKGKVLPLLKGNQLLIDWFMELFGNPIESLPSEFENVYIKKSLSDSDNSIDNYEEIHSKDLIECKNIDDLNSCGVKYKNGKLMYHGTLLPAKISFLAFDSPSPSSVKAEENSLCLHEIRKHIKFNEPKKEEESADGSKSTTKKHKLCDPQTLHAHAVRLNSIHAQQGEKLSDLAHLLIPSSHHSSHGNDERQSPKKPRNTKKTGGSPKKSLNKSPTSATSNATNVLSLTTSPSKALQTAKKLRNLIDDDNNEKRVPKKKRRVAGSVELSATKTTRKPRSCTKKSSDGPKKAEASSDHKELPSTSGKDEVTLDWTREEDKIILEEMNVGHGKSNEALLSMLEQKLTNRSRVAINSRLGFLLEVVSAHSKSGK